MALASYRKRPGEWIHSDNTRYIDGKWKCWDFSGSQLSHCELQLDWGLSESLLVTLPDQILWLCTTLCAMISFRLMPQWWLSELPLIWYWKSIKSKELVLWTCLSICYSARKSCVNALLWAFAWSHCVYSVWHSDSSTFLERSVFHMPKKFSTQQSICEYT